MALLRSDSSSLGSGAYKDTALLVHIAPNNLDLRNKVMSCCSAVQEGLPSDVVKYTMR